MATTTTTAPTTLGITLNGNPITPQHSMHASTLANLWPVWEQDCPPMGVIEDAVADYAAAHDGQLPMHVSVLLEWCDDESVNDGLGDESYEQQQYVDAHEQREASDDEAIDIATRAAMLQAPAPTPVPTATPTPTPAPTQRPSNPAYADLQALARKMLKAGNTESLRAGCDRIGLDADRSDPVAMAAALEAFTAKPEAKPANGVRERKVEPAKPGQVKQRDRLQCVLNHIDGAMRLLAECNVADLVTMTALQTAYARIKRQHTELLVRMGTGTVADVKASQSRTDVMNAKPAPGINTNVAANSPAANPVDPTPSPKPTILTPKAEPKAKTQGDGLAEYRKLQQACKAAGVSAKGKKPELEARLAAHKASVKTTDAQVTEAARKQRTQTPTPTPVAATKGKTVSVEVACDRHAIVAKLLAMTDADFVAFAGLVNAGR